MNILITTLISDDLGLLARTLPVAQALAERGHRISFCNPAPAPARLIAEAGFENLLPRHPMYFLTHLSTRGDLNPRGLYRAARAGEFKRGFGGLLPFLSQTARAVPFRMAIPGNTDIWSVDHLAAITGMLNEHTIRAECQAMIDLIHQFQADLIIDSFNPIACLAARAAHTRLVTILQVDMHPAARGFLWWRNPPPNLPSPTAAINRVLASYGLDPVRKTEDLFTGDLSLILGMPETDPLPTIARARYVGALLWQKPNALPPDWFADLDPDRPVIWVYSGNPRYLPIRAPIDSEVIIQACAEALADEPYQVVLTTGHHVLPRSVQPLPDNFRFTPYLPGLLMAQRSSLLIHHGGFGSCQTGLFAGIPALIIPTYSERESNARRLIAAGAGEMIVPSGSGWRQRRIDVTDLRVKVRALLSLPSYRENAQRLGEKMRAYGGPTLAVDFIEEFLRLGSSYR